MPVEGEEKAYLFVNVLLLFQLDIAEVTLQGEEYAFVPYFDVTDPIEEVEFVLNYHCLRWVVVRSRTFRYCEIGPPNY